MTRKKKKRNGEWSRVIVVGDDWVIGYSEDEHGKDDAHKPEDEMPELLEN
jgi:hypothetical protein